MQEKQTSDETQTFLFSYLLGADGRGTAIDTNAVGRWTPADGDLWVHFDIANHDACRWLERDSGLSAPVVDALLAEETRPRTIALDKGLVIVLRGVNTNPGADPEDMVAVRVWIEPHRVISTRRRRLLSVVDIANALDDGSGPASPSELLATLVDRLAAQLRVRR